MEDREYEKFSENMQRFVGIDLGLYKEAQMNRRMRTLFEKRGFKSYDDYYYALKKDPVLLEEFLERMTINVTEFFRNETRWQVLREKIVPDYKKTKTKVKCWSAACSTGEEPYSLAMLLLDQCPGVEIDILATDIDDLVLKRAKEGIYTEAMIKGCPPHYVHKFFRKGPNDTYIIKDEVKKCVRFKKHNLLHEPFEQQFDLIICRNVMIYFTEEAKEQLYRKFNQGLGEKGIFFVGSTEQIFHPEEYNFEVYDAFFYSKIEQK